MIYTNYITVTDRVAAQLVKVTVERIGGIDIRLATANGTQVIAVRIARQAARQGLLPADLDQEVGEDVLHAIAATIPGRSLLSYVKSTDPWTGYLRLLPDEWKHVVNAAERQLVDQWSRIRR
jgi:hypothetical protein